ncbi:hypothetical protein C8J57DRAFT_1729917 [Mycena rebaudengoi]|nr:hypothetical protein C8J57DRAFT_1729917 [Mycena rebaudengoi]
MELGGVVLPAELERAVFEAAAVLDYRNILRLVLVAQRVHTWLKPFLYHVLVYRSPNQHGTDAHELFGTHVRHLMLFMDSSVVDIAKLLAVCSAVQSLACYCRVNPSCLPPLALMRPLRLCIHAVDLFASAPRFSPDLFTDPPRFSHALFARTTHLQLLDFGLSAFDDASWASLRALPCLTHLALDADDARVDSIALPPPPPQHPDSALRAPALRAANPPPPPPKYFLRTRLSRSPPPPALSSRQCILLLVLVCRGLFACDRVPSVHLLRLMPKPTYLFGALSASPAEYGPTRRVSALSGCAYELHPIRETPLVMIRTWHSGKPEGPSSHLSSLQRCPLRAGPLRGTFYGRQPPLDSPMNIRAFCLQYTESRLCDIVTIPLSPVNLQPLLSRQLWNALGDANFRCDVSTT